MLIAQTTNGELLILGLESRNIDLLKEGKPMRISKESHPGFPLDCAIVIVLGDLKELQAQLKPLMDAHAVVHDHRRKVM